MYIQTEEIYTIKDYDSNALRKEASKQIVTKEGTDKYIDIVTKIKIQMKR